MSEPQTVLWWRVGDEHPSPQPVECAAGERPTPTNRTFSDLEDAWEYLLRDRSLDIKFAVRALHDAQATASKRQADVVQAAEQLAAAMRAREEQDRAERTHPPVRDHKE